MIWWFVAIGAWLLLFGFTLALVAGAKSTPEEKKKIASAYLEWRSGSAGSVYRGGGALGRPRSAQVRPGTRRFPEDAA